MNKKNHLFYGSLPPLAGLGRLLDDLLDRRHLRLESLQLRVLLQHLKCRGRVVWPEGKKMWWGIDCAAGHRITQPSNSTTTT